MTSPTTHNITNAAGDEEVQKCARCGKCRSVCPVFAELKDEAFVARGRVWLFEALKKGELPASPELKKIMSACLMCQRCSEVCPSDVDFVHVINAAREHLTKEMGLPFGSSLVLRQIVTRRRLFDAAMRAASLLQRVIPGKRKGTLRHLPLFFKGGKWLPPISKKPALSRSREPAAVPNAKMRVALFVGCLTNYVYPDIMETAVELLQSANIEAIVPESQLCCGTPAVALGDMDAARELARRNRDCLSSAKCDFVLTLCASCGRTLKHEYADLLGSGESTMDVPVLDISEFIVAHTDLEFDQSAGKVTYHDPCHLRWGQGIESEPRQLLARASRFEEMSDEMYCCGQAGSFHVFYPEIAHLIGRRKIESLSASDASEVATGCPGCILQLNDLMAEAGMNKNALHTIEVLARSIRTQE